MSVDKAQVRDDYLRGFSVRMLAAKYGVPKSTVGGWVKKYGWVQEARDLRKILPDGTPIGTPDGTEPDNRTGVPPEELPTDEDYAQLRDRARKLMTRVDTMIDVDDKLSARDLKSLSGVLLDVKQLLNILSPREAAEQEMRLRALRKQAEDEDKSQEPVVVEFVNREWDEPLQSAALTAPPEGAPRETGGYDDAEA